MRLIRMAMGYRIDVILEDFGDNKIAAIKAVREISGLGLKEAKVLVESTPAFIMACADEGEVAEVKEKLEAAGCIVTLK